MSTCPLVYLKVHKLSWPRSKAILLALYTLQVTTNRKMRLENEKRTETSEYRNPDPYFLVPKAMYFFLNWFIYSTHGFYNQYLKSSWGMDTKAVSATFFWQAVTIVTGPYWGSLADRTGRYRQVAAFCVIMNCLCLCLMAFPLFQAGSWARTIYFHLLSTATAIFSSGTFPIIDAIVLSLLEADPTTSKDDYGYQKMFGAIAHNICTEGIHKLYDWFAEDYFVMFYSATTAMLILVSTIMLLVSDKVKIKAHKHHGPSKTAAASDSDSTAQMTPMQMVFKPEFFLFSCVVLAAGIVRCVNTNNHSQYLTDVLFLGKGDVGKLMYYRIPVELGLLFFAKRIMQKTGPYWFLLAGLFVGVWRMYMYSWLVPDECGKLFYYCILILIEVLKGANSSLISSGAFRIASDLAPPHLQASAQTFVAACWHGLPMSCSSVLATLILTTGDPHSMISLFNTTTNIGFVSLVVISIYYAFFKKVLF